MSEKGKATEFVAEERQREVYYDTIKLKERHAAPEKVSNGLLAMADGTNWNPGGTGQGLYVYYAAAWHKCG